MHPTLFNILHSLPEISLLYRSITVENKSNWIQLDCDEYSQSLSQKEKLILWKKSEVEEVKEKNSNEKRKRREKKNKERRKNKKKVEKQRNSI